MKSISLLSSCIQILRYDIMAAMRDRMSWFTPVLFYILVISIFAISFAGQPQLLQQVAPAVIWVAILLANLLSLERLLRAELLQGCLEQLCLSPLPLTVVMLTKVIAHWLVAILPVIVATPLVALLLHLPTEQGMILLASLLVGTPIVSLVGGIGAALTVSFTQWGDFFSLTIITVILAAVNFCSRCCFVSESRGCRYWVCLHG